MEFAHLGAAGLTRSPTGARRVGLVVQTPAQDRQPALRIVGVQDFAHVLSDELAVYRLAPVARERLGEEEVHLDGPDVPPDEPGVVRFPSHVGNGVVESQPVR